VIELLDFVVGSIAGLFASLSWTKDVTVVSEIRSSSVLIVVKVQAHFTVMRILI
jgi:hypothetical protein